MSEIVEFDVGGTMIKTTLETVQAFKESKLYSIVKMKDERQRRGKCMEIFIDHNPKRFQKVLDCLRDKEFPKMFKNEQEKHFLLKDLKAFGPFSLEEMDTEQQTHKSDTYAGFSESRQNSSSLQQVLLDDTQIKLSQNSEVLEDFTLDFPASTSDLNAQAAKRIDKANQLERVFDIRKEEYVELNLDSEQELMLHY